MRNDADLEAGGRARRPPGASAERLIEPLTRRELQILVLVCDGDSNQEISERIGVSVPTVKYHLLNIFGKLGVRRRTQAVAVAVHLRLVRPDWLLGAGVAIGGQVRRTRSGAAARPAPVLM